VTRQLEFFVNRHSPLVTRSLSITLSPFLSRSHSYSPSLLIVRVTLSLALSSFLSLSLLISIFLSVCFHTKVSIFDQLHVCFLIICQISCAKIPSFWCQKRHDNVTSLKLHRLTPQYRASPQTWRSQGVRGDGWRFQVWAQKIAGRHWRGVFDIWKRVPFCGINRHFGVFCRI